MADSEGFDDVFELLGNQQTCTKLCLQQLRSRNVIFAEQYFRPFPLPLGSWLVADRENNEK